MTISGLAGENFNVTDILNKDNVNPDFNLSLYSGIDTMDDTDINDAPFDMTKLTSPKEKEALGLIQTKLGISIPQLQTYDMDTVAGLMAIARAMDAVEKGTASGGTELDAQKDLLKYADNFLGKLYGVDTTIMPAITTYQTWVGDNQNKFDAANELELTDGFDGLASIFSPVADSSGSDSGAGASGDTQEGIDYSLPANDAVESTTEQATPSPSTTQTVSSTTSQAGTIGGTVNSDFNPSSLGTVLKHAESDPSKSNLIADNREFDDENKSGFKISSDRMTLSTDANAATKQGGGGAERDPRSEVYESNKWNVGTGTNSVSVDYENMDIPDTGSTNIMQMMGAGGTKPIIQIAISHGRIEANIRQPQADGNAKATKIDLGAYQQGQPLNISLVEQGGEVDIRVNGESKGKPDISAWQSGTGNEKPNASAQFRAGVYGQPGASVDIVGMEISH